MHCWNTYNNTDNKKKCTTKVFWHNVITSSYEQLFNINHSNSNLIKTLQRLSTYIGISEITADCPIIDYRIIKQAITIYNKNNYDCVSNSFVRSFPDGMDVSVVNSKSLIKTNILAKKKKHKEHVTLFIKENPKIFKKFINCTGITSIIFIIIYLLVKYEYLNLRI